MADAMGNSFLIVVLPLYIASGQVEGTLLGFRESFITGIILGLYGLVSSFLQPFTGHYSDKAGKRKIFVVVGLFFFMLANFSYIYAQSYTIMLLIRAVQGAAAALTITATIALVSEVSSSSNRGKHMGTYNSFRLIGFGTGPLLSGLVIESGPYNLPVLGEFDGFTAAFLIAGVTALLSMILVMFMVRDPDTVEKNTERMQIKLLSDKGTQLLDSVFSLGIITFIMSSGFALLASIEPQINERLDQGAFIFSLQFSALVGMLALTQPFVGNLSDTYGRKRFIYLGMILLIPVTFIQGFVTESWHLIAARALQGISGAMVFAPALALAGDLSGKTEQGSRLSILTVSFGLGISFGAFLSGYAIRFGFAAPFIIGSVLAAIGVIVCYTQVPER